MSTITSANSIFLLSVATLFSVPQQIEGFAADTAWATDAVSNGKVVLGVDGKMSAGWVPHFTVMTITLQPDQSGVEIFNAWALAEEAIREKLYADGSLTIPSINKKYVLSNGVLTSYQAISDGLTTLSPMAFKITWESVMPSLLG